MQNPPASSEQTHSSGQSEARTVLARLGELRTEVLRLGAEGYTSKQIARALGISPHTVDQRFRTAIVILGARDRRDCSRIFANLVASAGYQLSTYQFLDVAQGGEPAFFAGGTEQPQGMIADSDYQGDINAPLLNPEQHWPPGPRSWVPFPSREGRENELTIGHRIFWMILISVVSIFVIKTVIETLSEFGRLLRQI